MKRIKILRKYNSFEEGQTIDVTDNVAQFLLTNSIACLDQSNAKPKKKKPCKDGDCKDCEDCSDKKKKAKENAKKKAVKKPTKKPIKKAPKK